MTQCLHLVLLPGVLDAGCGAALEVARAANRLATAAGGRAPLGLRVCGPAGPRVRLASGLVLDGVRPLVPCGPADWIVVPGVDRPGAPEVLRWLRSAPARTTIAWLRAARAAGAHVHAGCTATFLAAEAGLLDGAPATTTWWLAGLFAQRYPQVRLDAGRAVVRAGPVTTAGAAFAHADLMLALVEQALSVELARRVARWLLVDGSRAQAALPVLGHLVREDDDIAARAERWVRAHLDRCDNTALAAALHVSTRTLARRLRAATGLTPQRFVQRIRTERALQLLQGSRRPVDAIAAEVGYQDAAALRRLLRRRLGAGPAQLRRPLAA